MTDGPTKRTVQFAAEWIVPIILVLLIPAGAAFYVFDHQGKVRSYQSDVAACERGRALRTRINTKFRVYDEAFAGAARALDDSTTAVGRELHRVLEKAATTETADLPLTNCALAYDAPRWFWQKGPLRPDPPATTAPEKPNGPTGPTSQP